MKYDRLKAHRNTNTDNLFRSVRFTGQPANEFVCDSDNSHFATLEDAVGRRDYLESPAGIAEIAEREAIRERWQAARTEVYA